MKLGLVAYGDESIQHLCNHPRYLLAATVYAVDADPTYLLRRIKPPGAPKLHWYDLDKKRQAAALGTISQIAQQTTIVAAMPLASTKTERARRKSLKAMILELLRLGVGRLILESRNATQDKRDIDLLLAMRRKGEVATFDIEHISGKSEPLLWVPDQILGAYGEAITNGADDHWQEPWSITEKTLEVFTVAS